MLSARSRPHRVRQRLAVVIALGGVLVLCGGGGLAALESNVVSSYGEGVWWALSLVTTVGFVGETPESTAGRLLSAILMVAGFAMVTLTTATIASMLVREDEAPEREAETAFEASATETLRAIDGRLRSIEARLDRLPDPLPPAGDEADREPGAGPEPAGSGS